MSQQEDAEMSSDQKSTKKVPLREILPPTGDEGSDDSSMKADFLTPGEDTFSTPVARVRSLKDNRNAIFVAAVTRQSDEDWDTLFEKEREREKVLREQFADQRRLEEEEERKAKVEAEKKQLPLLDQSKVGIGSMSEVVREVLKLVSEGEKLTDAVADAYQANDTVAYTLAAREIVRRASPFHLTALIVAASEAEKLGLSLQQSKTQDHAILESRVDHIINIANQFDRLQTFLNKQKISSTIQSPSTQSSSQSTSTPSTTTTTTTTVPSPKSTPSLSSNSTSTSTSTSPKSSPPLSSPTSKTPS